ncbi:MAG: PASTA domain-containing protein [Salinimicrobium sp.]
MTFLKFLFSKTFLIQLVLAAVALVLIVFILMQWLDFSTNQDERIVVPNLARLSLDKVDEKLDELELRREILDSANYNPDFPPFAVIDQVPLPGKFVKENRKIYLTLNPSGYRKVEIPQGLIRRTRRQVEPTLKSLGFEIGSVTYKPDVAKDAVLELRYKGEKVEPGMKLLKTSKIDMVLGDGSGRYGMKKEESTDEEQIIEDLESEDYDF